MQDFLVNVSRYPRYLISLILGIFIVFFQSLRPFFNKPLSAIALSGAILGAIAFFIFTFKGMLGLNG